MTNDRHPIWERESVIAVFIGLWTIVLTRVRVRADKHLARVPKNCIGGHVLTKMNTAIVALH